MEKPQDTFTVEDISSMFGVTHFNDFMDDAFTDVFCEARQAALRDNPNLHEDDADDAGINAESDARIESYNKWERAFLSAVDSLMKDHGLVFHRLKSKGNRRKFKVKPIKSWADALEKIRETINGMGPFYFGSIKEVCDSIPCSVRQGVLHHIGWIADAPKVYGSSSVEYMMRHWDR